MLPWRLTWRRRHRHRLHAHACTPQTRHDPIAKSRCRKRQTQPPAGHAVVAGANQSSQAPARLLQHNCAVRAAHQAACMRLCSTPPPLAAAAAAAACVQVPGASSAVAAAAAAAS